MKSEKKLYRSTTEKMIGGVCGGIAEYFDWDPTIVRIFYTLVSIFSAAFPGIIVYLVFWVIVPKSPEERPSSLEKVKEG